MLKQASHLIAVVAVTLLALGLRLYAAQRLDVDFDEPVYLSAAVSYANAMRSGELKMLAWDEQVFEHPALYKILYGVILLTQEPLERVPSKDLPRLEPIARVPAGPWDLAGRYFSVFWGTLAVLVLSVFNPMGGFFMAVNTLSVKYTSELYLEALPALTSLMCILAYRHWFGKASRQSVFSPHDLLWLMISANLLGATAAGKYAYAIVGAAIGVHFLLAVIAKQIPARNAVYLVGWGIVSALSFFAFDPYLWPHPVARLLKSISFHANYEISPWVLHYDYPFWQPLRWLAAFPAFYDLHPGLAFLFKIDTIMFVFAVLGLPALLRKQPLFFSWLLTGLAFLFFWGTKWPQYAMIIMAPFSLSAAYGVVTVLDISRFLLLRAKPQAVNA